MEDGNMRCACLLINRPFAMNFIVYQVVILLKKLQSAHNKGDVKDYPLCSDCYVSDRRVDIIFDNLVKYIIFKNPNQTASFYQNKINDIVNILKLKNNYYDNLTKLELIN